MKNFPEQWSEERENMIYDSVLQKDIELEFVPMTINEKGNEILLLVTKDALKIDGIRVNVTAETQQKIADTINCLLLTPKIADYIYINASIRIPPKNRSVGDGSLMGTTQWMIKHSKDIDEAAKKAGWNNGILSTVGKHWAVDNWLDGKQIGVALNYGWHFTGDTYFNQAYEMCASEMKDPKTNKPLRMIQGRGTRHNYKHADYSQTACFVSRRCLVNGVPMDLEEIYKDQEYSYLVSSSGPLKVTRQSGVKKTDMVYDLAPALTVNINDLPKELKTASIV